MLMKVFLILMYCDLLTIGTWGHPFPHKTCWRFKWMVPKQAQFLRTWIRYVYQKSFGEFWISWPVGLIASRFGAKFQILSRNWACKNQMRSNLLRTIKCSYPCSWTLMNIFCSTKDLAFSTKLHYITMYQNGIFGLGFGRGEILLTYMIFVYHWTS